MSIFSRPYSSRSGPEFDRIFKQHYSDIERQVDAKIKGSAPAARQVIDKATGRAPTGQKMNQLYAHAKVLKDRLKDTLLTRTEAWTPTEDNVQKAMVREKDNKDIVQYSKIMKMIGADPSDRSLERLRRRK